MKGTRPVSRDIKDAHPYLQARWPKIKERFRISTGNDLILTCVWRSVAEQKRLYARGRLIPGAIVTYVDGETKKSKHNLYPARAIDVAVVAGGKVIWDEDDYKPLGRICEELKLDWGGNWEMRDFPHIQVPANVNGHA